MNKHHNDRKPYVGPSPINNPDLFFGRTLEVHELTQRLIARRVVLLHSPSGAGKTSLIKSGLYPEMENQGFRILPVIRVSGGQITDLCSHKESSNPFLLNTYLSLEKSFPKGQQIDLNEIVEQDLYDYVRRYMEVHQSPMDGSQIGTLVVFDQFEEIITLDPTNNQAKIDFFTALMPWMFDNNFWFLFAMREDYLAGMDPFFSYFPDRLNNTFRLDYLQEQAALEAMIEPANSFGVTFERNAAIRLCNDLRLMHIQDYSGKTQELPGPYVEPVQLQVVCTNLWDAPRDDLEKITIEDIEKWGQVTDALEKYYSDTVKEITTDTQKESQLRQWIEDNLITGGKFRSQVLAGQEEIKGLNSEIIKALTYKFILREINRRGSLWYELAHDRLVEPIKKNNRDWFKENLHLLQNRSKLWAKENRSDDLLLKDHDLAEAQKWAEENQIRQKNEFKLEIEFLDRSQTKQNIKDALDEKERKSKRRLRISLLFAASIAFIAIILSIFALGQYNLARSRLEKVVGLQEESVILLTQAEGQKQLAETNAYLHQEQKVTAEANLEIAKTNEAVANFHSTVAAIAIATAEANEEKAQRALVEVERLVTQTTQEQAKGVSQRLAFQAQQLMSSDPDLAALLGIEAYNAWQTTEATKILLSSIYTSTLQVETIAPISGFGSHIYSIAFSPNERYIAAGTYLGYIYLIDLNSSELRAERLNNKHDMAVHNLAFSPDSTLLASTGAEKSMILQQIGSDQPSSDIFQKYPLTYISGGVSFSPDGKKLAVANGYVIYLYDVTPGSVNLSNPTILETNYLLGYIHELKFAPDGIRLATSEEGDEGNELPDWVGIFDTQTGSRLFYQGVHTNIIKGLAWSPDGHWLFSTGIDGSIIVWDSLLKTNRVIKNAHNKAPVYSMDISYDGRYLITGGYDGYTRIWAAPTLEELDKAPAADLLRDILAVAFSRQSYMFASGGTDKLVYLRRLVTQPSIANKIDRAVGPIKGLSVKSNGDLVWFYPESGNNDYLIETNNLELTPIRVAHNSHPTSATLHPNGQEITYGTNDGIIYSIDGNSRSPYRWPLIQNSNSTVALAYSTDGLKLASAHCDLSISKETCVNGSLWLWNTKDHVQELLTEIGDIGKINALAFDPLETYLAIGTESGAVYLYDLATGRRSPSVVKPSAAAIHSLKYSPDGALLVAGNSAGDILLWNAASGYQEIGSINVGFGGSINSIAFDPEGDYIYTGAESGDILKWAISPELWVDIICQRIDRDLTSSEWQIFFFNDEVQSTCP